MERFDIDEEMLIDIFYEGTRLDTLRSLLVSRVYIREDEPLALYLTDSVIKKLKKMTDEEFDKFTREREIKNL